MPPVTESATLASSAPGRSVARDHSRPAGRTSSRRWLRQNGVGQEPVSILSAILVDQTLMLSVPLGSVVPQAGPEGKLARRSLGPPNGLYEHT